MRLFARLLRFMRPYLGQMLLAALLLAVAGGLMSVVIATLKPLVNEVLLPPTEKVGGIADLSRRAEGLSRSAEVLARSAATLEAGGGELSRQAGEIAGAAARVAAQATELASLETGLPRQIEQLRKVAADLAGSASEIARLATAKAGGEALAAQAAGLAEGAADLAEVVGQSPEASGGLDILQWLQERIADNPATAWLRKRAFIAVPLLLIGLFFGRGVILYFGEYLTIKTGTSVIRDLRAALYEALIFQSLHFFRTHPKGEVVSRVLNDVQRLQRISTRVLADLVRVGAMAPFMLLVVVLHDWRMSLFAMVAVPVMVYPTVRLGRRLRRASRISQEAMAEVSNLVNESAAGIKEIQGFSMERFQVGRFRDALRRLLRVDLRAGRAAALSAPVVEMVGVLAGAVLFYVAGRGIARGEIDPGDFFVVLGGLGFLFMSVRRLSQVNVEIQQAMAASERIFEILDWECEVEEREGAGVLPPFSRELRYEGVEFAYEGEGVAALQGIDLTVRRGELVAIVGPSGSGKSTLANLLPRFYDPTGGRITLDGLDIREATLSSLRSQIGIVSQETILFDDTVLTNLTCGRQDLSMEQVVEAARAAHALEFIDGLAQGFETRLGELGMRLSMGQRQRLAIARALLKDPPILILDEATSSLDAESEALVQEGLEVLLRGRAGILIAHRLATVRLADRIVALEAGRIVEQGTHEELLALGGLYARLHQLQFQA